ncbi:MAG TPA: hypothetical protein VNJ01_10830 [Bacteriovoracaceae bacterium]|nr:hypothetical protein [Bacteriovoracaceae bacterium]
MKLSVLFLSLFFVTSAFAFPYEVECTGKYNGAQVKVNVEQNFGGQFDFVPAEIHYDGALSGYQVRGGSFGSYDYSYDGDGMSLRVTFWPDNGPRWGSFYDGVLVSENLGNVRIRNLRCRYPNAK